MKRYVSFVLAVSLFILPFGSLIKIGEAAIFGTLTPVKTNLTGPGSGLVAWWTFDGKDVTDKIYDRACGETCTTGNNGYYAGGATSTAKVAGKFGQALNFDGVGNVVSTSLKTPIDGLSAMTVSLWFNQKEWTSGQGFVNRWGTSRQFSLKFYSNSNRLTALWRYGGSGSAGTSLTHNTRAITEANMQKGWHNVVFIYSDPTSYVYVDGKFIDSASGTGGALNTSVVDGVTIGTESGGTGFKGAMDDVRFYNRALSLSEIQQLYSQSSTVANKSNVLASTTNPLQTGLVGWWTMDGIDTNWKTGKTLDKSIYGNHGSLIGMSTSTSSVGGKIGQAFKFNGTNSCVDDGNAFSLNLTGAMSVSVWVRPTVWASTKHIIGRFVQGGVASQRQFAIYTNSSNNVTFSVQPSGGSVYPSNVNSVANSVKTGAWTHILGTYDGAGNSALYINGVLNGSAASSTISTLNDPNIPLNIGAAYLASSCGQSFFPGSIDDVRVYNRKLSASEVRQIYSGSASAVNKSDTLASTTNPLQTGLAGWWTMDGRDTDWKTGKTLDKSGNDNTGSLTGMSTSSSPVAGKIGQAINFDGVNDIINASNPASLNNLPAMSISVWTKINGYGESGNGFILDKSNFTASGWNFSFLSAGSTIRFTRDYDGVTNLVVPGANSTVRTADFKKWMHWAITVDNTGLASGVHIYKNGVEISYGTVSDGAGSIVSDAGRKLTIGNDISGARTLNGTLDDIRLYNRALAPAEVKQLYNMGK
jgi:hypothetical protein